MRHSEVPLSEKGVNGSQLVEKSLEPARSRIKVLASRPPEASRVKPVAVGLRVNWGHPDDSKPDQRYVLRVDTVAAKPK